MAKIKHNPNDTPIATLTAKGREWVLSECPTGNASFDSVFWLPFRVDRAQPRARRKIGEHRVYRFRWGTDQQRFARAWSIKAMIDKEPELYAAVEVVMREKYGPGWLTHPDGAGYSAADVEEERARLAAFSKAAKERKAANAARLEEILS